MLTSKLKYEKSTRCHANSLGSALSQLDSQLIIYTRPSIDTNCIYKNRSRTYQSLRVIDTNWIYKKIGWDMIEKLMMRISDKGLKIGDNVDDVELCSLH